MYYFALLTNDEDIEEVGFHLAMNGYPIEWENKYSFRIIEDYATDVAVILADREIEFICCEC